MASDSGDLLNQLGILLAHDHTYRLDETFFYAEAGATWVTASIFRDLGERLIYCDPSAEFCDAVFDLWYSEDPAKRWSTMQYRIIGNTFEASFTYEPTDDDVSSMERREIILQQRYGNKQVVYPPLP